MNPNSYNSNNNKCKSRLVIVESPAKCKKIEEYLSEEGEEYTCLASYGHLRELKDLSQIDVQSGYKPRFTECENALKKRQIAKLRGAIQSADEVILATDDDREGEGIAWHLCDMFGLNPLKTKRIVFHEITKSAILFAINNPRTIDMNKVYAQQTRQILDLLVGFKITPTLWKGLCSNKDNPLSAGRCQTPALRLLFNNDLCIREHSTNASASVALETSSSASLETYKVIGYFTSMLLTFDLECKTSMTAPLVEDFLQKSITYTHIFLGCSPTKKTTVSPPIPLTTSQLQQTANSILHIGVKDIMKTAQTLYEGGYITYMRTDSTSFSQTFIEKANEFIVKKWSEKYLNIPTPNSDIHSLSESDTINPKSNIKSNKTKSNKTKSKSDAKESTVVAHEAIRPTDPFLTPEEFYKIHGTNASREYKLYRLIWEHSIASLMASAEMETMTASISAVNECMFKRTCENSTFLGWKIISKSDKLESEYSKEWIYLKSLKTSSPIPYKKMVASVIHEQGPLHYTEAKLVHMLEQMGIGRPSTFSLLVDKIQEREYVKLDTIPPKKINAIEYSLSVGEKTFEKKQIQREIGGEKNKLILQPIGRIVSDFLQTYFSHLLNFEYTKNMESNLDLIAKGLKSSLEVCSECNAEIERCLLAGFGQIHIKKMQYSFDKYHTLLIGRLGPTICFQSDPSSKNTKIYLSLKREYVDSFDMNLFDKIQRNELGLEEIMESLLDKTNIEDITKTKTKINKTKNTNEIFQNKIEDVRENVKENNNNMACHSDSFTKDIGEYNGMKILLKNGRFGLYVSLENIPQPILASLESDSLDTTKKAKNPKEKKEKKPKVKIVKEKIESIKTISLKSAGENRQMDSFTREEIIEYIEGRNPNTNVLREISKNISLRKGPKGNPYLYFKTPELDKPMFYKLKGFMEDPLTCQLSELQEWIKDKYKVY